MTPQQELEWAERLRLVHDFARGAVVWAARNGVAADDARVAVARAAVLGVTPAKAT